MKVVVMMPFAKEFDPVFETIKTAVAAIGPNWRCVRIDGDHSAGNVLTMIQNHIQTATICIADITSFNPNVMWEVGYASALDKPVIAIGQSTEQLPFDISHLMVLKYHIKNQHGLEELLTRALQQTREQILAQRDRHVIAIAGSHGAPPNQARQAFENIATPYFGRGITWYCGARDPMQQEIVGALLDHEECVVVVTQQGQVIDSRLSGRLERHGARIVCPQDELAALSRHSTPSLIQGFNATFTLYAQRAERVFLLWDGKSVKTREFHEWLAANGKMYLLAHV